MMQDALLCLVGSVMYMVSGTCALHYQTGKASTKERDISLTLGILCIITGIVMAMDFFVIELKQCKKKSQTK